jgi:hypothetical protein
VCSAVWGSQPEGSRCYSDPSPMPDGRRRAVQSQSASPRLNRLAPKVELPGLPCAASRPERSHLAPGAKPPHLAGAASPAGRPASPSSRNLEERERGDNRKRTVRKRWKEEEIKKGRKKESKKERKRKKRKR